MNLFKPFVKALAISGIVTIIVGGTVYSRVAGTEIDKEKLVIDPKPTEIYDRNGNVMARFYQERKDKTNYEEIPQEIIQAVVATEDREFFEHAGINVRAIARAVVEVVKAKGEFVQGGSTITQQLVKNIYLHNGKTLERKQEEAIYATVLEKMMTKEEILASYVNHNFYGHQSYGIRDAVYTYYGQSLEEFKADNKINRIVKAALVAGIPQSPSVLTPYVNAEAAKNRRNTVILNMKKMGFITDEEYNEAVNMPFLVLKEPKIMRDDEKVNYPEFTSYVLDEAAKQLKTDVTGAMYSGLKIYTSFDPEVYKIMRDNFKRKDLFPQDAKDGTKVQGAGVFLNPNNGEIYALTGGRQETKFLEFNRAYQMYRQPGSTFKPIISYGPAMELDGMTPWDLVMTANGSCFSGYCVKGGSSTGWMPMEYALAQSYNVTSVWLLQKVGITRAREYAERLGIKLTDEDKYLPIALGGLSKGVTPLSMADAYQAYANGGYRIPAHAIRRMVNKDGEVVYSAENTITDEKRVIKKKTADYMKMMLRGVVLNGTGRNADVEGQFIAGKTGTTEYEGEKGNKDIWFMGFGRDFVGGIWMGYDTTDDKHYLKDWSSTAAMMYGQIADEMVKIYPSPLSDYKKPEEVKPEVKEIDLTTQYDEKKNEVELTWEEKEDTYYLVYKNGVKVKETKSNKYTDDELEQGTDYTYQVFGVNKYSKYKTHQSDVKNVTTAYKQAPPAPTNFTAVKDTETEVTLSWDGFKFASEYILNRNGEMIYSGNGTTFTDTLIEPTKETVYELTAKNEHGESKAVTVKVAPSEGTTATEETTP